MIVLKKGIYYITTDLWPSKQSPDTDSIEGLNIQLNFQGTPQLSLFGFKLLLFGDIARLNSKLKIVAKIHKFYFKAQNWIPTQCLKQYIYIYHLLASWIVCLLDGLIIKVFIICFLCHTICFLLDFKALRCLWYIASLRINLSLKTVRLSPPIFGHLRE